MGSSWRLRISVVIGSLAVGGLLAVMTATRPGRSDRLGAHGGEGPKAAESASLALPSMEGDRAMAAAEPIQKGGSAGPSSVVRGRSFGSSPESTVGEDRGPIVECRGTVAVGPEFDPERRVSGNLILRMERYSRPPGEGHRRERRTKKEWLQKVDVVEGGFTFRSEADDWFVVSGGTLDGRVVGSVYIGRRVGDKNLRIEVWFKDQWLEVVDAATGEPLREVEVIQVVEPDDVRSGRSSDRHPYHLEFAIHPSAAAERKTVCESATSPINLGVPDKDGLGALWFARAPGYGWLWFDVDPQDHPTLRLELSRAASLSITTIGAPRSPEAMLRVTLAGGRRLETTEFDFEVPADPDEPLFSLSDLSPMEVYASVEIGRRGYPGHLVLAESGAISLAAGRAAHVTLRCSAAPIIPARVPLAGTVIVPPSWMSGAPSHWSMELRQPDPIADVVGTELRVPLVDTAIAGVFRFDAGEVVPGLFSVTFSQPEGWSTPLRVGPTGDRDVRIEIPDRSLLLVKVIGVDESVMVQWSAGRADDTFTGVEFGGPVFELGVPVGPAVVRVLVGGTYQSAWVPIDVRPGSNALTIPVDLSTGVRVVWLCDGKTVPWAQPARLEASAGQAVRGRDGWPDQVWYVDPGEWTVITDSLLPGGGPPNETVVIVPNGEVVDVMVPVGPEK